MSKPTPPRTPARPRRTREESPDPLSSPNAPSISEPMAKKHVKKTSTKKAKSKQQVNETPLKIAKRMREIPETPPDKQGTGESSDDEFLEAPQLVIPEIPEAEESCDEEFLSKAPEKYIVSSSDEEETKSPSPSPKSLRKGTGKRVVSEEL